MNKNLIPTWYFKDLMQLDPQLFVDKEYQVIFCDIDNTLCSPYIALPDKQVTDWVTKLKKLHLQLILISNNDEKRVSTFASALDVPYLYRAKKPNPKKLLQWIQKLPMDKKHILLIGDQIMTDVVCANRAGIDVLLVDRKTNKDQWITFIPRRIDKIVRKKLKKANLLRKFV